MQELVDGGVEIRIGSPSGGRITAHQKTYWFHSLGDTVALIGSGNATHNSRDRCYECGVQVRDPYVCETLKERITELFEHGRPYAEEVRDARAASEPRGRQEPASASSQPTWS